MSNIQDKMIKKKGTGGVVAQMVKGNIAEPEVESISTTSTGRVEAEANAAEPKKEEENLESIIEGVIAYKQVPVENKTVRKNIVIYPSLSKEIERIIKLEQKKGNKRFTFNDLVNQVLIDYVNNYNKK